MGDTTVMDLVFGVARREMLKLSQKVNLKLMLGCTITLMEYGHHGIPDTTAMDLVFGDARREKPKPNQKANPKLTPGYTTTPMEYGHHGTLDITVLTDGNGDIALANFFLIFLE